MHRFNPMPVLDRHIWHARILWISAPQLSLYCLLLTLVSAAARTAALITTGGLIGALPDGRSAWAWFAGTALALLVAPVANSLLAAAGQTVSARYLETFTDLLMEAGTHPHTVEHLEDPKLAGRLEALGRAPRDWLFMAGTEAAWVLLSIRLGGLGALLVLLNWHWWAPIPLLAGWLLMSRGFARWNSTLFDELLDTTGNDRRRADYLRTLLTERESAKEVRLFGLSGWLLERYDTAWRSAMRVVWTKRNRGMRVTLLTTLAPLAANSAAFALLAREAYTGALGVGALVTLVQAVLAMGAFGPQNDPQSGLARVESGEAELMRIRAELGLPGLPGLPGRGKPGESATGLPVGERRSVHERRPVPAAVELRELSFRYPSQEQPVISGLDLSIPPGQSVAIVGVNGVGKSTLIKLLCGLYRPDSGTVRIDGRDPGDKAAARPRIGVVFQNFVRYHLSLRENVGAGAPGGHAEQERLDRALSEAGGASLLLNRLEHGWETVLAPEYERGTDLSGGQWQRVALARALAAGAGLLVLDEPTAALDVRAEAELFERFLQITRGVTTVLVSHRLSSVRHAERIVVLGGGDSGEEDGARVVEDGTHEELLAAGGRYAELFTLQAARFASVGTATTAEVTR